MITKDTWDTAQIRERAWHNRNYQTDDWWITYYEGYFGYLGIEKNCGGKTIVEIGCADFPALTICENYNGIVIEPLPSDRLLQRIKGKPIRLIKQMAEEDVPDCDEVWMFNLLQHVVSPEKIIENAKKAKVVRFFEPIDFGTDTMHLHNFTLDYFKQYFDDVRLYPRSVGRRDFHQHQCAYGVYTKK